MVGALAVHRRSQFGQGVVEWVGALLLGVLLLLLLVHTSGVLLDLAAALRFPFGLESGEGLAWYQAAHSPVPLAYPPGQGLPFVPLHDPPLYPLLVRGVSWVIGDMLLAGRVVSILATLAVAPLVAALVVTAGRRYGERLMARHLALAAMAGLLVLNLHAVRSWGMYMRPDMVGVALGLAGLLIAARANGRVPETTLALLLCAAAAYTQPIQALAGIAIFVVTVLRKPRKGLIAGGLAALVALGVLAALQWMTEGRFLAAILDDGLGRSAAENVLNVLWPERWSGIFILLMLLAGFVLLLGLWRQRAPGPRLRAVRQLRLIVKLLDPTMAARATLLLQFGLATLVLLVAASRPGGSYNVLLGWLCMGCVLVGVLLCDLLENRGRFVLVMLALGVGVALQPFRQMPDRAPQAELDRTAELVRLIAGAAKPVASEDITLLLRAGKPVPFDPQAATLMAGQGLWDERPLVEMVRSGAFAFVLTGNNVPGATDRRSAAVDAAMRGAYPRVERVGRNLWINLPL